MKRIWKLVLAAVCVMLGSALIVQAASAADTTKKGWYTSSSGAKYYYQNGKKLTGWQTIDGSDYYFEKKSGTNGMKKGQMYTGMNTIDGKYFYFGTDGKMVTRWKTVNSNRYYFTKKGAAGVKGAAYTGWNKIGKYQYYFSKKGVLRKNRWVGKKYVDEKGRMLTSCITPDGYWVNANGVKQTYKGWKTLGGNKYYFKKGIAQTGWKEIKDQSYYFNSSGVMQTGWLTLSGDKYYLDKSSGAMKTGWQTIGKKKYYFDDLSGKMLKNTTVDGIKIGSNGVADIAARVLVVAGHGQGDAGATSKISGTSYKESTLTRSFAKKIRTYLRSAGKNVAVDLYNTNYDLYQVNNGTKSGAKVTWTDYDYVLEVHFNATATSSKDLSGDGKQKGISIDVPKSKAKGTSYTVSKAIIKQVKNSTGFTVWSGESSTGLVKRNDLLNMRLCNSAGVSYGLLETCFIDDKDDMTFYNSNTDEMAKAVADGLISGLGL